MGCLLRGSEERMKDFDSIVDHMWVRNFDYGRIELGRKGPLVPEGGRGWEK